MLCSRLRKFLIISLTFHALAFSVAAAFFQPGEETTRPRLIKVGVISKYKDSGAGSGSSIKPPPKSDEKEASKQEKEIPKPKKEIAKPIAKKKQEKEPLEEKKVVTQVSEPVIEQSTVQPRQNTESEETTDLLSDMLADIEPSEEINSISAEGYDPGGEGTGRGVEVGYPDYKINPKPQYPMIARRNGYEGMVLLNVWVLESGKVGKVELEKSSGYGVLDDAALDAVKDWIFIPGKRGEEAVSSWVTVPIRFELSSG